MKRLVCLFTAFSMLLGSVLPVQAQRVAYSNSFTSQNQEKQANFEAALLSSFQRASNTVKSQYQQLYAFLQQIQTSVSEEKVYAHFVQLYKNTLQAELKSALNAAKTPQEKQYYQEQYRRLSSDEAIQSQYRKSQQKEEDNAAQQIQEISELALNIWNNRQGLSVKEQSWLVLEAAPILQAMGALDPKQRLQAAAVARTILREKGSSCSAVNAWKSIKAAVGADKALNVQQNRCGEALSALAALGVLGQEASGKNRADAAAVAEFFKQGINGISAPEVILQSSQALLALNGGAELEDILLQAANHQFDKGLVWDALGYFSAQGIITIFQPGLFGAGYETSFYPQDSQPGQGNAWFDLGKYLAQISSQDARAAQAVNRVMKHNLGYSISKFKGNVGFDVFAAGALAGGYKVNLRPESLNREYTDQDGIHHTPARSALWASMRKQQQKAGQSETMYFIRLLLEKNKENLDPHTRLFLDNELKAAYNAESLAYATMQAKQAGQKQAVFKTYAQRQTVLAEEMEGWQRRNNWQKAGFWTDIVLLFTGSSAAVVKGVSGLAKGVKILRLARAGAVAADISFAQSFKRVVRLSRFYKTGAVQQAALQTHFRRVFKSWKPVEKTPIPQPALALANTSQGEAAAVFPQILSAAGKPAPKVNPETAATAAANVATSAPRQPFFRLVKKLPVLYRYARTHHGMNLPWFFYNLWRVNRSSNSARLLALPETGKVSYFSLHNKLHNTLQLLKKDIQLAPLQTEAQKLYLQRLEKTFSRHFITPTGSENYLRTMEGFTKKRFQAFHIYGEDIAWQPDHGIHSNFLAYSFGKRPKPNLNLPLERTPVNGISFDHLSNIIQKTPAFSDEIYVHFNVHGSVRYGKWWGYMSDLDTTDVDIEGLLSFFQQLRSDHNISEITCILGSCYSGVAFERMLLMPAWMRRGVNLFSLSGGFTEVSFSLSKAFPIIDAKMPLSPLQYAKKVWLENMGQRRFGFLGRAYVRGEVYDPLKDVLNSEKLYYKTLLDPELKKLSQQDIETLRALLHLRRAEFGELPQALERLSDFLPQLKTYESFSPYRSYGLVPSGTPEVFQLELPRWFENAAFGVTESYPF